MHFTSLIGGSFVLPGTGQSFVADCPGFTVTSGIGNTGKFFSATPEQVEDALAAAYAAFFIGSTRAQRAQFLRGIASGLENNANVLVPLYIQESGLPEGRARGELARTTGQLRFFADMIDDGRYLHLTIDTALPDAKPVPQPDIRKMLVGRGPVAIWGASNFPFAFSVAGGDFAAAIAAGCPVIFKAHRAHPALSASVAEIINKAREEAGLDPGWFALIQSVDRNVAEQLLLDIRVAAGAMTGSQSGGIALRNLCQQTRPERGLAPIPFFAEMSAVNPVLVFPGALGNPGSFTAGYLGSLTLGAGQFCTNPGVLIVMEGEETLRLLSEIRDQLPKIAPQTMLTTDICRAYATAVDEMAGRQGITLVAESAQEPEHPSAQSKARVFSVAAQNFLAEPLDYQEEMFGAAGLVVVASSFQEMLAVVKSFDGQLTTSVFYGETDDRAQLKTLLPVLDHLCGRTVHNGWPTGVRVCAAMVHAGPWPSTSTADTSVGGGAVRRFQMERCWQNTPQEFLPVELQNQHTGVRRTINGVVTEEILSA